MKRIVLLLLALSMLGLGGAFAQDGDEVAPPEPNFELVLQALQNNPQPQTLEIKPIGGGMNPPNSFTPTEPACSYAADSYLQAGVKAVRTNQVEIGEIVYGNADPEVVYTLLYILLETQLEPMVSMLYPQPAIAGDENIIPQVALGTVVNVLGEMTCWLEDGGVGRFWKVEANGLEGYMLETLSIVEAADLSEYWDVPENSDPNMDLNAPDNPILVEDITFRLLKPYVEVPPTTLPGANEIGVGDAAFPTPCEYGAPSHLAVGMQAEMAGPTYMKLPNGQGIATDGLDDNYSGWNRDAWDMTGPELEVDDFGLQRYVDLNTSIPVREAPIMDGFFADAIVVDKTTIYEPPVYGTQIVTIIGGPACDSLSTRYIEPDGIVEYDPLFEGDEQFYTLWQISLEVKGQVYVGWYPESTTDYVWWKYEDGDTDRTHFFYFLQPIFEQRAAVSCEELPLATLSSGATVKPVFGNMNLRNNPNGGLAGEITPNEVLTLLGEPVCAGGAHWWLTDRGAWIAENNPETRAYVRLLEEVPVVIEEDTRPSESTPEPSTEDSSTVQQEEPAGTVPTSSTSGSTDPTGSTSGR